MSQDSLKGSLLADKTPYSNDGTIYGATFATDRMGQPNKAMSFDGTHYITVPNKPEFNFGTQMSAFIWIKGNDTSVNQSFLSHWDDVINERSWLMYHFNGNPGKFRVYLSSKGSSNDKVYRAEDKNIIYKHVR